jgi:hypothetical protein
VSFVHDDRDFPQLLTLVTEETRIAPALVEKDYWARTACGRCTRPGSLDHPPESWSPCEWTPSERRGTARRP